MLNLKKTFDLQKDVFSHILRNDNSTGKVKAETNGRIHNVERDGGVLYSWKEMPGTTRIGKYDLNMKEHKLLYVFDEDVLVSSCSLNKEETLLAVSLSQKSKKEGHLRSAPEFLTLLIEIQPINNTKVLKAVDCTVRVQFLYPEPGKRLVTESHLLLIVEDGYVEQFHIPLTKLEGYRVVIQNPERLAKDRIAEELCWVQWDGETQRLFYITSRERPIVKCQQFYPDCNCETVFELPMDLATNPFVSTRFVNLGCDYYKDDKVEDEGLNLVVLTSRTGSMCMCYSQPLCADEDITYTIAFVHRGYSRTYTVAREEGFTFSSRILFFQLGYYIVVYLADCFLHLINARKQDLPCYSLFLSAITPDAYHARVQLNRARAHLLKQMYQAWYRSSSINTPSRGSRGASARLGPLSPGCLVLTFPWATFLDPHMGRMYWADLSSPVLLQLLRQPGPDAQRLAALHCLLGYLGRDPEMERQVVDWICESVMPLESFDQIQEFMLASLYWTIYQQSPSLDSVEVLPYSSLFEKKDLCDGLKLIPGVRFTSDLLPPPSVRGKAQNLQGYWEELQWNIERMKYFEAVPNPRFRTSAMRAEWTRLQAELRLEEKKPSQPLRNIEENTKKVLSLVDTWQLDKKVLPLFHNEDHQQRALIGLMVDKLREHMNRHLPRLGKKKIERLVVSYVAKLLKLVRHLLEALWGKYKLEVGVLSVAQQGSAPEWAVFHMMTRILEATAGLCLPLPPGYHTLLSVLGMRCLPRYTFMQYVDHGLLQLTEPFISRLMTDLDNSPDNEELKFSIMKRLPEPMEQKTCQLWDHPITSASISRGYVKELLEKRKTKGTTLLDSEKSSCSPEFLPLTYLAKILSDVESQALNPFEGQENVDAKFVEETALKQTMILLGLEDK